MNVDKNVWVIIPAYNEGKRVSSVIDEVKKYSKKDREEIKERIDVIIKNAYDNEDFFTGLSNNQIVDLLEILNDYTKENIFSKIKEIFT